MKKIAPIAGLATCLVLYSVIIITAIPYVGQQNESYSIFNHFISELGSTRFSANNLIYNYGVILAAILFGTFTFGLGAYAETKLAKVAVGLGMISSILCMGVGFVPEEHRIPHLVLALGFFSFAALATLLFSWSIWKEENNPFPKYTAIHGVLVPISFAFFMSMPKGLMLLKRAEGAMFVRPELWWLPFLEWVIFGLLTSWIFIVSIKMFQLQRERG
jgi:hypothetical membrane protein